MSDDWIKIIARAICRIIFDLPFAIIAIRLAVWWGIPEKFEFPAPTMAQTVGIAIILVFLTPHS